ncbi:uncharacterized protein [Mytilus edulis]|uniref:uncharacterized protein n=1 Tax=Mytilus edulis TaxID=6550 RepID=UPI0039F0DD19
MSRWKSTMTVYLEDFLLEIINYFEISKYDFKIKILEYSPISRTKSKFLTSRKSANTEISSLGIKRTKITSNGIYLKPVLEDALEMLNMTTEIYRKKVIVLFLNNIIFDHTTSAWYAKYMKQNGVVFYVVTSFKRSVDTAMSLASDPCKAFVVDDYKSGMDDVISDLGNNICLASDPRLAVTSGPDTLGNCNIGILYKPPETENHFSCAKDGLFQDPLNCAYFYKCTRGTSVHLKCEPGNMFDARTHTCNHKMAVTCYTGVSCPDDTGLFPYPNDCFKFLNCFQGMPYVQPCPSGLAFDKIVKRCLLPMHALC